MKGFLALTVLVLMSLPFTNAGAWDWKINDKKGFTKGYVTDTKDKTVYRDKKGFLEGWYDKRTGYYKNDKGQIVGSTTFAPGKGPNKK
jgi:hypothetical protein